MNSSFFKSGLFPWQFKLVYLLWIIVWVPAYCFFYDPRNLFWMCDVANLLLLFAIGFEISALMSAQAAGVFLVQIAWAVDFFSALLFGTHLIGGTEYMFDEDYPIWLRAMSLFHLVVPVLLFWCLSRMGYDKRGLPLQTVIIWLLLPLTYLFTNPEENVNWLWKPFGMEQTLVSQDAFLWVMMVAYPVIVFVPTHLLLKRIFPCALERARAAQHSSAEK